MERPDFIDNRDGNTLARALEVLLTGGDGVSSAQAPSQACIASAYFSPAGFAHIADKLSLVKQVRLMLGPEPPAESVWIRRPLDQSPEEFQRRKLRDGVRQMDEGLRSERDRLPFTRVSARSLRKLVEVLRSGRMEVRRYEHAFMHAKAYVFLPDPTDGPGHGVIVGSSNLTSSGLSSNLELNLGRYDHPVVGKTLAWFDALWQEATPVDLAAFYEATFAQWQPWDVYLRVLWQLYGAEIDQDALVDRNLPLTSFQKHGVARALRLIEDCGGVVVADEVGLGKTFIAGEILQLYHQRRQRALLVCPAALRDSTWKKFLARFQLFVECVSYEELANDRQLRDAQRPVADQEKLQRPLDEYQLIVVDEAHNYRNPDTPTRAAVLRSLLFGQRRDVLLLTATPVNNSLWDMYHLIRFFVRQDAHLADRGILSIRGRFEQAMRQDPSSLSPDTLYPVIDATTVKRTRQFIKKHYQHDTIIGPDGRVQPIVFPQPRAITVRYNLEAGLPGFFDKLEEALDPNGGELSLSFARYDVEAYRKGALPEAEETDDERKDQLARARATTGLLRSGLLKRFESSAYAFRRTVQKMANEHSVFLDALRRGRVVTTSFLHELAADDEMTLDELIEDSDETLDAADFDVNALRRYVTADRDLLTALAFEADKITLDSDPKLASLIVELRKISVQAADDAENSADEAQKRKVLVFSFFADTVKWINDFLQETTRKDTTLKPYRGRVVAISGSKDVGSEVSRQRAVYGFAPVSSEAPRGQDDDLYDILVTTDILAEGVNLQQCRHVINFDVPWNPMRLVQRHGRIDRISSPHKRVFLRTIFPADRLDDMLHLEERILNKLAMAAASVGVIGPIEHAPSTNQVFAGTREEIERLLREDPDLYERGGTASSAQTGEEYRQTLRKALAVDRDRIVDLPWKAGSGMVSGHDRGLFFCATVGDRTYVRFVKADSAWKPLVSENAILRELGSCLRLIECDADTARMMPVEIEDRVFDYWQLAQDDIYQSWMIETDPVNLQPKVRPLNLRVAEFIRSHAPAGINDEKVTKALDILESPWPRREEVLLRGWFHSEATTGAHKSTEIVERVLATGIEPYRQPPVLPPIQRDDIQLICWMAVSPADSDREGMSLT